MSNYQVSFDYALKDLQKCNPEVVVRNALVKYRAENSQYIVPFFKQPYIVSVKTGEVFEQNNGRRSPIGIGTMIMHYLIYTQDITPAGRLVSLKKLSGCSIFFLHSKKI